MMMTAAKSGYGTTTWYANHGESRLTNSGNAYGYEAAKLVDGLPPKLKLMPLLPETRPLRGSDLRAEETLRAGDRVNVIPAVVPGRTYQPPAPPHASLAEQNSSAKSFILHWEHKNFLTRVSTGERPPITRETASLATMAWHLIWKASDYTMPVPAACTGPDGKMFYSWDHGRHHLELEIIPGQDAEFFYRDRETGQLWGEDYRIGDPLPAEAVAKLRFFR
jgi:hypothetical protein